MVTRRKNNPWRSSLGWGSRGNGLRMSHGELRFFMFFIALLLLWHLVGIPFFSLVIEKMGLFIGFTLFMATVLATFMLTGGRRVGLEASIVIVSAYIITNILGLPRLVPWSHPPRLDAAQSLAADVYFYEIFQVALPHKAAWIATYFGVPIALVLITLLVLKEKATRRILHNAVSVVHK